MKIVANAKHASKVALLIGVFSITGTVFSAPINSLDNAGFESPNQGSGFTYYSGLVSGWTYSGDAGIAANNSAFSVFNASGNQAAFLQGNGSNASISQSIDFVGTSLSVTFLAEYRHNYGGNTLNVTVDGAPLTINGSQFFSSSTDGSFTQFTTNAVALSSGQHVLAFNGFSQPDYTTFIDDVKLNVVPEPTTVALLGLGLLGFAASRRKASKTKNA
jgi:hypothetical protein